ncbi:MAG: nucleoside monophosphate kinase [Candidatus Nomurabacteria bacterium]|jgi:adenylate kinase family enzyme|nr:nucleoside monophosphate kinase [Candidatus Nomurabacteria bacterium]
MNKCERKLLLLQGFPGSGKTTMSEKFISENRGAMHVSIGDIWRNIKTGKVASKYSEYIMNADITKMQPNEITNDLIFEKVLQQENQDHLVIIDGYPRCSDAVELFIGSSRQEKCRLLGCICLQSTIKNSTERMVGRGIRRGEEEFLAKKITAADRYNQYKIETYDKTLRKLSEYMPLQYIDANRSIEQVYADFVISLSKMSSEEYGE